MTGTRTAVLLMAYGTPRSPADVLPYYTDIRRGRAPTDAQLADLIRRYDAIGGISPLAQRTNDQCQALQRALDEAAPGEFTVAVGLKHADPTIEATVDRLAELGFDHIVAVVLAPHFSAFSVGQYLERARAAATRLGLQVATIESWATEPALIDFLAAEIRRQLAEMPAETKVLFTAHSLPQRIIDVGDPYPAEVRSTAAAVAAAVGLARFSQWAIAWQSAGRTPEPWIGPDILQVITDLGASENASGVLVCACGFVADHLEVLYDLDIEARDHAVRAGLDFERTACVNDDANVMAALARRVMTAAGIEPS